MHEAHAHPETIVVSQEMTVLVGRGPFELGSITPDAIVFGFGFGAIGHPPTLRVESGAQARKMLASEEPATRIVLVVMPDAVTRLGGAVAALKGRGHHLPSELRAIALAIRDCETEGEARKIYRGAKGIELLCELLRLQAAGALVPLAAEGMMSLADSRRIMDARRMIEERAHEKLTLDSIARACGLNRAKLTRGFRDMFDCTIAETIAERRLMQASQRLLTTDLPVSSIGYESGYLNNASFARAFARRFGRSPSDYRAARVAA